MLLSAFAVVLLVSSALAQFKDPHCVGGRDGIVHLFEWKWSDIASECETFLGPYGFCGVQTSPANENRIVTSPDRPWYERYQPVSYKIATRSGDESSFKDMVQRCNAAGVNIYVDVVLNHMAKLEGSGAGTGTGGSTYNATALQFPGVPYGPLDFNDGSNCHSADQNIHNYQNAEEVRNCRLDGLVDLNEGHDYVRGKISDFLNHLIDLGVAGFRMDAAKHMWPADIDAFLGLVKDVKGGGRPFVYQEVIDQGGEPITGEQYFTTGRVTNFKFGLEIAKLFTHQNPLTYLKNWGVGWGMWDSGNVVNFIDNHDNQRGHGGGGVILTHWDPKPYKMASALMLAHPYGMPRVMSSFEYNRANNYEGPPHNADMSTKSVGHDGMLCTGGWSCEHRWRQIYNMVAFRNNAAGTNVTNWWSGADYKIAFSRGNKAFIAFNLEDSDINESLQTGLPAGTYCDVIGGDYVDGACTGTSVSVSTDGTATINVCSNCEDPVLAIHVGAKVGSPYKRYG